MKIKIIVLTIIILIIASIYYFVFINKCSQENITESELVGTYVMRNKFGIDTLKIYENNTFIQSSSNMKYKNQNGKWKPTIEGYFELKNYMSQEVSHTWDMKPFKCNDNIYIEVSYDGTEKYIKMKK